MLSSKFVVHPNVDLDAVVSWAILGARPEEIFFVPAGAKELPVELTGARVVDHPLGEKGRLEANGVRHAAACSLPEAAGANPALLSEVDEQDSTGLVKEPQFSLAAVLAAVKSSLSAKGLTGEALDRATYEAFRPIVEGLNQRHHRQVEARAIAKAARIVNFGDFKAAVLPSGEQPPAVGMVLNQELDCSIQLYQEGSNLGIFRYPGRNAPDLRLLASALGIETEDIGKNQNAEGRDIWFLHPAGFLAAWGSKKSPKTSPPPAGTPQSIEELLRLLVDCNFGSVCSQCERDPAFAHIEECKGCSELREEESGQMEEDARAHQRDEI